MNSLPIKMSVMFATGMFTMAALGACSAEANRKVATLVSAGSDIACAIIMATAGDNPTAKLACEIEHAVSSKLPNIVSVEMRAKPTSTDGGVRFSAAPPVVYTCTPTK